MALNCPRLQVFLVSRAVLTAAQHRLAPQCLAEPRPMVCVGQRWANGSTLARHAHPSQQARLPAGVERGAKAPYASSKSADRG